MSARLFWPAALGLSVLALGLWTYRREIFDSTDPAESRIRALGPVFIAAAIACFSGEHFTDAVDLVRMVPQWLPLRIPITYLVGISLLAAGLSIASRIAVRWSAPLLALLFALFVLLIYVPSTIRHPQLHLAWIFPFREGSFAMAAFSIFVYETRPRWSGSFSLIARFWAAFVIVFYGVLNLRYPHVAPGVPSQVPTSAWVPFPSIVAYLTGALLVTFGAAVLLKKTAVSAIAWAGILMAVLTVVLYVPNLFLARSVEQGVTAINFVADTLLFAGSMFVIATAVSLGGPVAQNARSQTALSGSLEPVI